MRIGIDYRSALINREGIGRTTRELVRALVELGHGEQLGLFGWTLAPMRFARSELGLDGSEAQLARFRFPSRWIPDLLRTLERGVDDLVGGADVYHHTQPHLLPVRRAVEVATVFDVIYTLGENFVSEAAAHSMTASAREMVRRAKLVLVPSVHVAHELPSTLGAQAEALRVVPLGCDHVLRYAGELQTDAPRAPFLLTVSRVDARKNHLRLLRAFERLVHAGFPQRWIVAGPDGHGSLAFDAALRDSSARARVERLKQVGELDLARLYAGASLFVFPSLAEGFGLPPLEAMIMGVPVIAANTTALPEVLGDAAVLVDPLDETALFEALRDVLSDAQRLQTMAARGRAHAQRFTWRACAERTLAVYREALTL